MYKAVVNADRVREQCDEINADAAEHVPSEIKANIAHPKTNGTMNTSGRATKYSVCR